MADVFSGPPQQSNGTQPYAIPPLKPGARLQSETEHTPNGRGTKLAKDARGADAATLAKEKEASDRALKAAEAAAAKEAEEAKQAQLTYKKRVEEWCLPIIAPRGGIVRDVRPRNPPPRFAPARELTRQAWQVPHQYARFNQGIAKGEEWVWVQIHNRVHPGQAEVDHFHAALKHFEEQDTETDEEKVFEEADYSTYLPKRENGSSIPALVVFCRDQEAAARLILKRTFAFANQNTDLCFFIQGAHSFGTGVTLELIGASINPDIIAKTVAVAFEKVIKWAEPPKEKATPTLLKIQLLQGGDYTPPDQPAQVNQRQGSNRGGRGGFKGPPIASTTHATLADKSKTVKWRVHFATTRDLFKKWTAPSIIQQFGSNRQVSVRLAPFCTSCMSYSHHPYECTWWEQDGVQVNSRKPNGFQRPKWHRLRSIQLKLISEEEKKAASAKAKNAKARSRFLPGDDAPEWELESDEDDEEDEGNAAVAGTSTAEKGKEVVQAKDGEDTVMAAVGGASAGGAEAAANVA